MGKIVTPKYRLEWTETGPFGLKETHHIGWNVKDVGKGRATSQNAIRYLRHYENSTKADGCNSLIGPRQVLTFALIEQKSNTTVASGKMPECVV
jgi:hypothetical protein